MTAPSPMRPHRAAPGTVTLLLEATLLFGEPEPPVADLEAFSSILSRRREHHSVEVLLDRSELRWAMLIWAELVDDLLPRDQRTDGR